MLGIYALGQAFALPLQFLSFLSIRQRYLTLEDGIEANFLAMRIIVPAFSYTAALIFIFFFYGYETIWKVSASIFVLKYIEGFFDLAYAKMQKEGRARSLAKISTVRSLIAAALFLVIYLYSGNIYTSMLAIAIQQFALLGYIRSDLVAFLPSNRFSLAFSVASATALVPFALSSVLTSLSSSLPRLILDRLIGTKELGYYTAVITFVSIGQIVVGSVGQSLLETFAGAFRRGDHKAFWSSVLLPALAAQIGCYAASIISLFLGSAVVTSIYGAAFEPAVPLLTIASITSGPFFAASFFTAAVFAAGQKYALVVTQMVALAIMLTLTLFLVPIYHAKGAFLSMGISGVCQMLLCSFILRAHLKSTTAASLRRKERESSFQ